jgi:uncharacterized membrane-anchored protein YjiN (DUF445 family)
MIDKTSNQAAADPSIGVLVASVEARTGRSMTPAEAAALLDNVWRLRRTARTVHECVETTRKIKKRLAKLRADKEVLERAAKIVKYTVLESDRKQSTLTVLKDQLNMFNDAIAAAEGSLLRDLLGESFEGGGKGANRRWKRLFLSG